MYITFANMDTCQKGTDWQMAIAPQGVKRVTHFCGVLRIAISICRSVHTMPTLWKQEMPRVNGHMLGYVASLAQVIVHDCHLTKTDM